MQSSLKPYRSHVLGKSIMDAVRRDEANTTYPLGLERPPVDWGTTNHGKLTADQWGVIATKSLLVTLVHQWGYISEDMPESPAAQTPILWERHTYGRQRRLCLLHNFVDLVKASLMAHNRTTSKDHARSYDHHIQRFFSKVTILYPSTAMKPSGHVSMHLGRALQDFGPTHSYKAPGFERMNYEMQSTPTNNKRGMS